MLQEVSLKAYEPYNAHKYRLLNIAWLYRFNHLQINEACLHFLFYKWHSGNIASNLQRTLWQNSFFEAARWNSWGSNPAIHYRNVDIVQLSFLIINFNFAFFFLIELVFLGIFYWKYVPILPIRLED